MYVNSSISQGKFKTCTNDKNREKKLFSWQKILCSFGAIIRAMHHPRQLVMVKVCVLNISSFLGIFLLISKLVQKFYYALFFYFFFISIKMYFYSTVFQALLNNEFDIIFIFFFNVKAVMKSKMTKCG